MADTSNNTIIAVEHPGKVLDNFLQRYGMSQNELAIRTGVSAKHICTIISGDKGISADFARKLAVVFGNGVDFWREIQSKYDDYMAELAEVNEVTPEEVSILRQLKDIYDYSVSRGILQNNCGETEKVLRLRRFLCINNLESISKITYNAAYRAQLKDTIKVNPYVVFAWQRLCEIETDDINTADKLNIELLMNNLDNIKALMHNSINKGIDDVQKILAMCGIAFNVVHNFKGAPVQGFIKAIGNNRIILCLTIRNKRADSFWFTLFHEIGHIIYGHYQTRFVDFSQSSSANEDEANEFAKNMLIPENEYREFIRSGLYDSERMILNFSKRVNVKPFVVIGRLQNDGLLDWSAFPQYIDRYEWADKVRR